ncbi:copper amine oxidase N-terminal domain-containing protein [Caldalkalibacillus mannanilyticus]|uniref:copper amine oxidase N-terminal domain-containing protein n=1 Tax=Caldalkalibacillus mannanilyticus TaxID=1418 RepID=UPI00046AFAEE|nr:copper amine oxidase N-terminal domain-containing protein [Caldalkalibacillus mannanilyticus]
MKKTLSLFLVFFMLFALVSTVSAAEQPITVKINGETQTYNQPPVIKSGSTLVPLRGIFESLGASVFYDASTKKIHATKGSTVVELQLGKKEALVNGKKVTLSVAAEVMNGSTMVPLRFISESLGANVVWDGATRTITITSKQSTYKSVTDYQGTWISNSQRLDIYFVEKDLIRVFYYYDTGTQSGPYWYDYAYARIDSEGIADFTAYNEAGDRFFFGGVTLLNDEVHLELIDLTTEKEMNVTFTKHDKNVFGNTKLTTSKENQAKLKNLADEFVKTINNQDVKGYLSLIDSNSPDFDTLVEMLETEEITETVKLVSFNLLFGDDEYVAAKVTETYTSKDSSDPYTYTATSIKSFVNVDGKWKLGMATYVDFYFE